MVTDMVTDMDTATSRPHLRPVNVVAPPRVLLLRNATARAPPSPAATSTLVAPLPLSAATSLSARPNVANAHLSSPTLRHARPTPAHITSRPRPRAGTLSPTATRPHARLHTMPLGLLLDRRIRISRDITIGMEPQDGWRIHAKAARR